MDKYKKIMVVESVILFVLLLVVLVRVFFFPAPAQCPHAQDLKSFSLETFPRPAGLLLAQPQLDITQHPIYELMGQPAYPYFSDMDPFFTSRTLASEGPGTDYTFLQFTTDLSPKEVNQFYEDLFFSEPFTRTTLHLDEDTFPDTMPPDEKPEVVFYRVSIESEDQHFEISIFRQTPDALTVVYVFHIPMP